MLTDYGRSHIARVLTGQETTPATLYLALCTTSVVQADDGSTIIEPTAVDYARQSIPMDGWNWSTPAYGEAFSYYTYEVVYYPSDMWGSIVGFALCDAATLGNIIHYGGIPDPLTMVAGATITVPAYALYIQAI
jgi:hypothetical protein